MVKQFHFWAMETLSLNVISDLDIKYKSYVQNQT